MQAIRRFVHLHPAFCCSFSVAQPSAIAQCCVRQFGFNAFASCHAQPLSLLQPHFNSLGNCHPQGRPHIVSDFHPAPFTWTRKRRRRHQGICPSSSQPGTWTSLHVDVRHLRWGEWLQYLSLYV